MSNLGLLSIGEVNDLDLDQFLWLFGNIVEKTSEAASFAYNERPFQDATHIVNLFNKYLDTRSVEEQENILRLHPDLGANAKMTEESVREQENAGVSSLTEKDHEILTEANYRYREKFGFPFVICARENNMNSVTEIIRKRSRNDKTMELKTGVEEIKKISKYRVLDLVWHD